MSDKFDVVVIGAGPAGYVAALFEAAHSWAYLVAMR